MNAEFQKIINQMEPLLRKLRCSDPRTVENLKGVPQRGVYVFYEGDKPFYTGRSRRIRQHIYEHGGTSSCMNRLLLHSSFSGKQSANLKVTPPSTPGENYRTNTLKSTPNSGSAYKTCRFEQSKSTTQ